MKYLVLVFFVLSLFNFTVYADQTRDAVERALARLDDSIVMLEENEPQAGDALRESAALLSLSIEQYSLETPGLYHALGNANLLSGDIGHAVLAYRRGEQLDPTNMQLRDSLAHARSLVAIDVGENTSSRLWSILLSWRGYISRGLLWGGFLVLSSLGWLALSSRALGFVSRSVRVAGIWMIVVSLIPVTMLGSEWFHYQGSSDAVVIDPVLARTGPDDAIYDPAFVDELQPGVEARISVSRDGWTKLELTDGSACWVPQSSVERVNPKRIRDSI
jgi:hypothetical protein